MSDGRLARNGSGGRRAEPRRRPGLGETGLLGVFAKSLTLPQDW